MAFVGFEKKFENGKLAVTRGDFQVKVENDWGAGAGAGVM